MVKLVWSVPLLETQKPMCTIVMHQQENLPLGLQVSLSFPHTQATLSTIEIMQSEGSWTWRGYRTRLEDLNWYPSLVTYLYVSCFSSLQWRDQTQESLITFAALTFFDSLILSSGHPGSWTQRLELFAIGTAVRPIYISTLYIYHYLYRYLFYTYQDIFWILALQLISCVTSTSYLLLCASIYLPQSGKGEGVIKAK